MKPKRLRPGPTVQPASRSPIAPAASSGKAPGPPGTTGPGEAPFRIPPILLEGDHPKTPPPAPKEPAVAQAGGPAAAPPRPELPAAYGTERLMLAARDPHCLYAHWDLAAEQQLGYVKSSAHRHLVLRVQQGDSGKTVSEIHLHPDLRHCFVPIDVPGVPYTAELGYYEPGQEWKRIARSESVTAPGSAPARPEMVRFTTLALPPIPPAPPLLPSGFKSNRAESRTMVVLETGSGPAIVAQGRPGRDGVVTEVSGRGGVRPTETAAPPWSARQERALAELLRKRQGPAVSSLGVSEGEEFAFQPEVSSLAAVELPAISSAPVTVPSRKGFWFNVNAELVVYGATEPGARVTLGGRPVALRPDGTFSFRFALPDGSYEVPLAATAVHGEVRSVELIFTRATQQGGGVGVQPQEVGLSAPPERAVSP